MVSCSGRKESEDVARVATLFGVWATDREAERQVHGDHKVTCLGAAPCLQPAVRETLHVQHRADLQREGGKYINTDRCLRARVPGMCVWDVV